MSSSVTNRFSCATVYRVNHLHCLIVFFWLTKIVNWQKIRKCHPRIRYNWSFLFYILVCDIYLSAKQQTFNIYMNQVSKWEILHFCWRGRILDLDKRFSVSICTVFLNIDRWYHCRTLVKRKLQFEMGTTVSWLPEGSGENGAMYFLVVILMFD